MEKQKIAALVLSGILSEYLEDVLLNISDNKELGEYEIAKVLVVNPTSPFLSGEAQGDKTENIFKCTPISCEKDILRREFKYEHEARNEGLRRLKEEGYKAAFIFDADEILSKDGMTEAINIWKDRGGCVTCNVIDYWKSARYEITPPRTSKPVILCSTDTIFYDGRCCRSDHFGELKENHKLYHFGFCLSNEAMKWKAENYHNKSLGQREERNEWFDKIWLAWDSNNDLENLGLVNPCEFKCAKQGTSSLYSYSTANAKSERIFMENLNKKVSPDDKDAKGNKKSNRGEAARPKQRTTRKNRKADK